MVDTIQQFNNFIESDKEIQEVWNTINLPTWSFGHLSNTGADVSKEDIYKFWVKTNLEKEEFYLNLKDKIDTITKTKHKLQRVYMNGHTGGSGGSPHQDSPNENSRTFLVYCNPQWKLEWGGATQFYLENEFVSFFPAPFSAIYFPGNIWHNAAPISPLFKDLRVTLAFKLEKQ